VVRCSIFLYRFRLAYATSEYHDIIEKGHSKQHSGMSRSKNLRGDILWVHGDEGILKMMMLTIGLLDLCEKIIWSLSIRPSQR
jgi:hypothetical protein